MWIAARSLRWPGRKPGGINHRVSTSGESAAFSQLRNAERFSNRITTPAPPTVRHVHPTAAYRPRAVHSLFLSPENKKAAGYPAA
jgi:hypothetical protein